MPIAKSILKKALTHQDLSKTQLHPTAVKIKCQELEGSLLQ